MLPEEAHCIHTHTQTTHENTACLCVCVYVQCACSFCFCTELYDTTHEAEIEAHLVDGTRSAAELRALVLMEPGPGHRPLDFLRRACEGQGSKCPLGNGGKTKRKKSTRKEGEQAKETSHQTSKPSVAHSAAAMAKGTATATSKQCISLLATSKNGLQSATPTGEKTRVCHKMNTHIAHPQAARILRVILWLYNVRVPGAWFQEKRLYSSQYFPGGLPSNKQR